MSDKALSALGHATAVDTGDYLYLLVGGNSRKIQVGRLLGTAQFSEVLLRDGGAIRGNSGTLLSDSGGVVTLRNLDALDTGTQEAIEDSIDALPNLVSIQGRMVDVTDTGVDTLFGWDDSESKLKNLGLEAIGTDTGPASNDWLLGYNSAGPLRKFLVSRVSNYASPVVTPEDHGAVGTTASATANNVTTEFLAAMNAAVAGNKTFVTRGYKDGTRKWYKITPTFRIPDGLIWEVEGLVGIVGSTASGILFRWESTPYIRGSSLKSLIIDGGNSAVTIAGGYTSDHEGLVVAYKWKSNTSGAVDTGTGYGTYIDNAYIDGVYFQNFGGGGLETYYLRDALIRNVGGERLGWFGTIHMSPLRVTQDGGRFDDVWPGIPAVPVYLSNAYGVGASHWGGETVPQYMEFRNITCERVTSWEGFDMHGARESGFINCHAVDCAAGIVFENHASGATMQRIYVKNCRVEGYGETVTRNSQAYYSLGGVIVNSSAPGGQAQQVAIDGVDVYNIGEGRPATQNGGGVVLRMIRNLRLTGVSCFAVRQHGVNLISTDTGDSIIYANIGSVLVDGVTTHASVRRGIAGSSNTLGIVRGCFVQGISSKVQAYFQDTGGGAAAPGYILNFGVVGDGASGTAASSNIAYGADT